MKHAVIIAHPKPRSFTSTMADAYERAARQRGHEVLVRDIYRVGFDPCLKEDELFPPAGSSPHDDVAAEREMFKDVGVFVLVYPLWFNTPPAILKGYIERVFGFGFGFAANSEGGKPLLASRKLLSISSSGAPKHWVLKTGAMEALRVLFDEHVAEVCGMEVVDHLHFGGITPNITVEAVDRCTRGVEQAVIKYF